MIFHEPHLSFQSINALPKSSVIFTISVVILCSKTPNKASAYALSLFGADFYVH